MIARAAASIASGARAACNSASFAVIFSCGKGSPITPVELVKTRGPAMPVAAVTAAQIAATDRSPAMPVKALELPELTRNAARPVPFARFLA